MREHHPLGGAVGVCRVDYGAALVDPDPDQPILKHPVRQLATDLQKLAPGHNVFLKHGKINK